MSEPNLSRPARKIGVADHIWAAMERMAQDMGIDRDGLINQALFMFARLNGYLEVTPAAGDIRDQAAADAGVEAAEAEEPMPEPEPEPEAEPAPEEANEPTPRPATLPPPRRTAGAPRAAKSEFEDVQPEPARRATAEPPAAEDYEAPAASEMDEDPDRKAVAERVLETAAELERLIKGKSQPAGAQEPGEEPAEEAEPAAADASERALYVMAEDGELDKVVKDRFLIGRGKHCDLVINSGKVSREHAAIVREGDDYYIEDLGSSNGTWFNKARIKRRKVEDGDEYFICSEKVKCVIR